MYMGTDYSTVMYMHVVVLCTLQLHIPVSSLPSGCVHSCRGTIGSSVAWMSVPTAWTAAVSMMTNAYPYRSASTPPTAAEPDQHAWTMEPSDDQRARC